MLRGLGLGSRALSSRVLRRQEGPESYPGNDIKPDN